MAGGFVNDVSQPQHIAARLFEHLDFLAGLDDNGESGKAADSNDALTTLCAVLHRCGPLDC